MSRALLFVFLPAVMLAQGASIRGELRDGSGAVDHLMVHLTSLGHGTTAEKAFVSPSGSFQFRSVAQGSYLLEVRDLRGDVITQQMLSVASAAVETSISLGKPATSNVPAGSPTVSVKQLRHDPDGRATREFLAGEDALLKQSLPAARKHFAKALKLDPDYPEAHTELGTADYRSGELEEARKEFERAVELDPKQTMAWGNLASLLYRNKDFAQAETAAHRGLEAAPKNSKLHFVAGASRMALHQYGGDTAQHLEQAAHEYPQAHILLAETLFRQGDSAGARTELQASLASTDAQVRARAGILLGKLGAAN